jgi:predicted nucleotidyltransferase
VSLLSQPPAGESAAKNAPEPRLETFLDAQPYPHLFVTLSGARLYGFASAKSDWDLRGAYLLPAEEVMGLRATRETVTYEGEWQGVEVDLVCHDAKKFFQLLLTPNGYALEQLMSPVALRTSPAHERLKELYPKIATRGHARHYLGFARKQWAILTGATPQRLKCLLYVYRVLLTGVWLMRTGQIETHLPRLAEQFHLPQIPELIERRRRGARDELLAPGELASHQHDYARLLEQLQAARDTSPLGEEPSAEPELNDLLVRLRLGRPIG